MDSLDDFYLQHEEPYRGCFLALREIILKIHPGIYETRKYGMPCYCLGKKPLVYLWKDKNTDEPYILFVDGKLLDHPRLDQGNRAKMKILPIDPKRDIEVRIIKDVLQLALEVRGFK